MKKVGLFIGMVLLVTAGFAQVKDQKALTLLNEVSAKAKSSKTIKADFSYTMENKQAKINETKKGTLLVSGDKYKLTAAGQTVICNGKTVWTYLKESNEVQVNNLEDKDEALTPSKLLTSYSKNYKATIIKDKANTNPNAVSMELIPNVQKNFTKAILTVDNIKKQVLSFKLFDKSGNIFTYKVTNYLVNVPSVPSDFTFDASKYPGVDVIDMR
ncbi:MAG TPA: outer membrane lipoprotein carrier protein LolA [Bacteroidales bacterium]|nr:outer membrane lipoprotein carrier protein LolA [Bacteroidales bacterium]HPS73402.1 outer membrane lipoprotein carrier protein LolA [Bacteroidales bacterium]